MKYRKKPIVIEAFKFGIANIPDWFMDKVSTNEIILQGHRYDGLYYFEIKTLEGTIRGEKGDFIIQGIKGEVYPCKPDIFEATYEPIFDHAIEDAGE
jgi:hypothetical protein